MVLYLTGLILTLFVAFGLLIFYLSCLYSTWRGSPYVPTDNSKLARILEKAHLKRGQLFIDLGCGDGRIAHMAARKYHLRAVGIDVNPFLIFVARLIGRLRKLNNTHFICQDIFSTDISKADVIYIFLMPNLINKLQTKIKSDTKRGAMVISHGFKIPALSARLYLTIPDRPFPTYYYRL